MKTISARIVPFSNRGTLVNSSRRGACSTTVLLALLGGGALAIALVNAHWSAVWVGFAALGLFLLIGTGVLPHALASHLQSPFSFKQPAQASFGRSVCIILLGEGSSPDPQTQERVPTWIAGSRIAMAAALYRTAVASGAKSQIIIAGERTRLERSALPSSYARMLIDLGVSGSDVMLENEGLNTYAHAKNISAMVKAHPAETIYLVTSALHMTRALLYFGAFDLRPAPFPSDYIHVPRQFLPVGYNFAVADIALHQHIGILRFHVYEALGLNRRLNR